MIPPPPMPWMPRVTISWSMSCAAPASTEPTRNMITANCSTTLRPMRSLIFPNSGTPMVDVSM